MRKSQISVEGGTMVKKKEIKVEIDITQDVEGMVRQRLKGEIKFYIDEGLEQTIPYLLNTLQFDFNGKGKKKVGQ